MPERHVAIAILLEDGQASQQLGRAIETSQYQIHTAHSLDELYQIIKSETIDVVIIRHQLVGFFTGLDVLERICRDLRRPRTMLLGDLNADEVALANQAGIDLILGGIVNHSMVGHALQSLLKIPKSGLFIHPSALAIVERSAGMPPCPQIACRLIRHAMESRSVSLQDFARDLALDPHFVASIYVLINNPAMNLKQPTSKIFQIVNMLGIRRTLARLSQTLPSQLASSVNRRLDPADRVWLQRRFVLQAHVASLFAEQLEKIDADTAYMLGLFQDVGIYVLADTMGERYMQTLHRFRETGSLRLEVIEQSQYGYTHADVSAALLQRWNMPSAFVEAALTHHRPIASKPGGDLESRFRRVLQIAEAVANLADGFTSQRYPVLKQLLAHYGREGESLGKRLTQEAMQRVQEVTALLQTPMPSESEYAESIRQLEIVRDS